MKKILTACMCITFCILLATNVTSDSVRYEFEEIEVLYGAEFIAVTNSTDEDNWLVQLAGKNKQQLEVLYGVFNLKNNDQITGTDVFLKVAGENGSRRFLRNSCGVFYNDDFSKVTKFISFFWSANVIVGNEVVKNFEAPIEGIFLIQSYNEEEQISDMKIIASSGTKGDLVALEITVLSSYSEQVLEGMNVFEAQMSTLNETGDTKSAIQ